MNSLMMKSKRFFQIMNKDKLVQNMALNIPLKLHLDEEKSRKYIISQSTTLKDLKGQLMNSDAFEDVTFVVKNQDNQIQSVSEEQLETVKVLRDCIMNKEREVDLKIKIDGQVYNYDVDRLQLGYFQEGHLDGVMQQLNIPHNQSYILNNFNQLLVSELESKGTEVSPQQVEQAIDICLSKLNNYNLQLDKENQQFLQNVQQLYNEQDQKIKELDGKAEQEGHRVLKMIILATIIQWIVLFYLTFYVYGWDFCEPIAYLIGLGIETAVLIYFIKTFKGLGQTQIFASNFKKNQQKLYKQNGTNILANKQLSEQKVKLIQSRIYFNKV